MGLWDKVSQGIDKAAKVTNDAIDEGKQRVAAYQARQRADKKAETLGYAVARARANGAEPDATGLTLLVDAVNAADAEASALEARAKAEPPEPSGAPGHA
jgi:hypothetical protein